MSVVTMVCVWNRHPNTFYNAGNPPIKLWQARKGAVMGRREGMGLLLMGLPSPGTPISRRCPECVHTYSLTERFVLEGTLTGHLVQLPARSSDVFNPIGLLRAPSNPTCNVPRDGASTGSSSDPFRCFIALIVKHSALPRIQTNLLSV